MNEPLYTLPSSTRVPHLDMNLVNATTNAVAAAAAAAEDAAAAAEDNASQHSIPTNLHSVRSNAPYEEVENKSESDTNSKISHKLILEQWNKVENLRTLFGWITISALNIECLNEAIIRYRKFIAYGTIMGLLFSTASGTISATQFNSHNTKISFSLNVLFTFFSFMIAVYTGILKTLQIQERLENFIKIKQEWILFSATISSELQLPIHLRTPVLSIIKNYKNKFLDLLKTDLEIPEFIKKDIIHQIKLKEEQKYKNKKWDDLKYSESSSLSDVIMEIGSQELKRLLTQESSHGAEHYEVMKKYKRLRQSVETSNTNNSSNTTNDNILSKKNSTAIAESEAIKRDLNNIYRQFAIIHKNVESMNSSISNFKQKSNRRPKNSSRNNRRITYDENIESSKRSGVGSGDGKPIDSISGLGSSSGGDGSGSGGDSTSSSDKKRAQEIINLSPRRFSYNAVYDKDKNITLNIEKLRQEQKKLDNIRRSISDNISSISDVYKNILDGTIAQKILESEESDEVDDIPEPFLNAESVAAAAAAGAKQENEKKTGGGGKSSARDSSSTGDYMSSVETFDSKV